MKHARHGLDIRTKPNAAVEFAPKPRHVSGPFFRVTVRDGSMCIERAASR